MDSLIIETYFKNQLGTSFHIPLTSLRLSPNELPRHAYKALRDCNIELRELLRAIDLGNLRGTILETVDYDSQRRLSISVGDPDERSNRQMVG